MIIISKVFMSDAVEQGVSDIKYHAHVTMEMVVIHQCHGTTCHS